MQKTPTPYREKRSPIDLVRQFEDDHIDLQPLLDSRKVTLEVEGSLAKYNGVFGVKQKKHLLNRCLVGYAERHLKDLDNLTLDQAIDLLFTRHDLGEPVNNYYEDLSPQQYESIYNNSDVAPGEPFLSQSYVRDNNPDEISGRERHDAIASWMYSSIYHQPTSIEWKLFLFLHNLTPVQDFGRHKTRYAYLKLVYEGGFRNYRDYIYDLTLDPTMLEYLNLQASQKDTPDENYAREVQELFTVGKRPFADFTEEDVREAARLLVGWYFDWDQTMYTEGWEPVIGFNEYNHDTGDKQFSEFYNNTFISGRSGPGGREELDEFLDMIFATEKCAIYLSRRLYQFFVYPVVSDYAEEQIIKPLAEVMRNSNYSLAETLKVLLSSEYFFAEEFYNAMISSPPDFTFKVMKGLSILEGDLVRWDENTYVSYFAEDLGQFDQKFITPDTRSYFFFRHMGWRTNQLGMEIHNPPNVSGWPAFYQDPIYDLYWINSVTIKSRKEFTESMTRWGMWLEDGIHLRFNLESFINSFNNPYELDSIISQLADRFLGAEIPEEALLRIRKSVLGEELNENYWTQAVEDFLSRKDRNSYSTLYWRIEQFMFQLFELYEAHLY
ncbi:MAG: DUF1800 domain-containing protein [Flavobacteriaceae bacterium]|nr:DUF1800 domain-containing protein [Flavobacteriaceae bacterium]